MEKDGENPMKDNIITETVAALHVTNQKLAELLGVPRAHVENWRYKGVTVPPDCLVMICRLLIGRVHALARIQEVVARADGKRKARGKDADGSRP